MKIRRISKFSVLVPFLVGLSTHPLCLTALWADSGQDAQMANQKLSSAGASAAGQGSADKLPFTGSFLYRYPIDIPPGTAGVQPALSLTYNSSAGNGWVGVGWDFSLGSIQRSLKNGPPIYDDSDIFVFNSGGASIELVSADGSATNYRPKIEGTFQKFVRDGNTWCLYDKNGSRLYFGLSSAGRSGPSATQTFLWALEKVIDRNGNYFTVTYTADGACLYPDTILYTYSGASGLAHRRVRFVIERRPDPSITFRPGFRLDNNFRLSRIETAVNPNGQAGGPWTTVRQYGFQYGVRQNGVRSLLTAIQVTGVDGTSTLTLPPHRFDYLSPGTAWPAAEPGNSGFQLRELITYGTRDNGVRFADLNGDGRIDMVRSYYLSGTPQNAVYLNTPQGWVSDSRWAMPDFITVERTGYWRDNGIRLIDVNGDGLADVVQAVNYQGTPIMKTWINNGSGFVLDPSWAVPDGNLCFTIVGGGERWFRDNGVVMVDVNGDGLPDLVQSLMIDGIGTSRRVRLNNGHGWNSSDSPEWIIPPWITQVAHDSATSVPNGVEFVDLNGDGLVDIVQNIEELGTHTVDNHRWLNTGHGWAETAGWDTGFRLMYRDSTRPIDNGIRFADMNGDGLPDLVQSLSQINPTLQIQTVRFNTGSNWGPAVNWNHPDFFSNTDFDNRNSINRGTALLDINGDGRPDFVTAYSQPGWTAWNRIVDFGGGNPELIRQVTLPTGGTTSLTYGVTSADGGHTIPFPVNYLASLTESDGRGGGTNTGFSYIGGLYDPVEREFLGFAQVDAVDAASVKTSMYFLQKTNDANGPMAGNPLKGRMYKQEIVTGSTIWKRDETEWEAPLIGKARFARVKSVTQTILDGPTSQATRTRYVYDDSASPRLGNITQIISDGDLAVAGDEHTQQVEYAAATSGYLGNFPKHQLITGPSGQTLSETQFLYDGLPYGQVSQGNVTTVRRWLDKPAPGKWVETSTAYNSAGLPTSATDARGNATVPVYDSYGFPTSVTDRLRHTATLTTDLRTGQPLSSTDPNGQTTTYLYDALGRVTSEVGPLDSAAYPTTVHLYHDDQLGNPLTQFTETQVRLTTGTSDALWTKSYFDGLGRTYRTDQEGVTGPVITQVQFDNRGLVLQTSLPRLGGEAQALGDLWVVTMHDALGRPTKVTQPDSTVTTTAYSGRTTTVTDALGRVHTSDVDAYGRVLRRTEPSVIGATQYAYDAAGNLTALTNAKGQVTSFTYDTLGRKLSMVDPNAGLWAYAYDDNGNLISQTDARGVKISLTYDAMDRLTRRTLAADPSGVTGKSVGAVLASLVYDETAGRPDSIGRLTSVSDPSGTIAFYHDALGRVVRQVRTVDGVNYETRTAFDAASRPTSIRYPSDTSIVYSYNSAGLLNDVRDGANTVLASYSNYDALGRPGEIDLASGQVRTSQTFDALKQVLNRSRTDSYATGSAAAIRNVSYQYDAVRNVTGLQDGVHSARTQAFGYDTLDRLTSARGLYGTETYTYDDTGDLLKKAGMAYAYGDSAHPDAVTKVTPADLPLVDTSTLLAWGLEPNEGFGSTTATSAPGRYGNCLSFNGTSDMLSFPNTESLNPAPFSFMLWVKPTAYPPAGHYTTLLTKSTGTALQQIVNGFRFLMYSDGRPIFEIRNWSSGVMSYWCPPSMPLNKWSFVSCSYDGSRFVFYFNGVRQGSRPFTGPLIANNLPVTLGVSLDANKAPIAGTYFKGSLDEPRIQGRAYSDSEMAAAYNAFNGGVSYRYDAAGNCLSKYVSGDNWSYRYDPEGRLDQVKKNGTITSTFVYDAFGSRVKKTSTGGTTIYIDGLIEVRPDGSRVDHVSGNGTAICDVVHAGSASSTYYFVGDPLSSALLVTNTAGVVVQDCAYKPFGERLSLAGASPNHRWYTGQEEDPETGLDYYNARYYDPAVGRFISPDSLVPSAMDPQSMNRYAYVRNNPINKNDPSGHSWLTSQLLGFVNPFVSPVATYNNVQQNREAYIAAAIAYVTTAGNPVSAGAAFATELGMQTGEGREITSLVARDVFVDAFGMQEKAAYIWANISLRSIGVAGIEAGVGKLDPAGLHRIALDEKPAAIEGGSAQNPASGLYGPSAANGNPLHQYYRIVDRTGKQAATISDGPITSGGSITRTLHISHVGANVVGYEGGNAVGSTYGTVAVCYNAANKALFAAGYLSNLTSLGIGGWSQYIGSVVWGNYGGGLIRDAYWAHAASSNYDENQ